DCFCPKLLTTTISSTAKHLQALSFIDFQLPARSIGPVLLESLCAISVFSASLRCGLRLPY
ncbi:MAG TPA: hypothetical protein VIK24_03220, partial [Pyrinomonadaceae bacterium]